VNCLYADPLGTAGHRYQLHVATASQRGMRQNRPLSEIDGGFACGAGARASRATGSPRCLFTGLSRLPPCALRAPVYPEGTGKKDTGGSRDTHGTIPVHWWVGMLVRFVCVIRVSVCVRAPPGVFLPVHGHGRSGASFDFSKFCANFCAAPTPRL